jgi:predicted Zn-dependent protease
MLDGSPLAQRRLVAYFFNRLRIDSAALQTAQLTKTNEPIVMFNREKLEFCLKLIANEGDAKVGYDPKAIATYLRLQASKAFRAKDYKTSACLGAAATAISEDARNDHAPDWKRAQIYMARAFE